MPSLIAPLLALVFLAAGGTRDSGPEINLALGRPYSMEPAPNYPLTTDPGDAVQLTDGKRASGGFWTDKAAVGWSGANPISITIDLGSESSITGAALSTAAGRADVKWPSAILLFGSLDGHSFAYLGDLVALDRGRGGSPPPARFARYSFEAHSLGATFRYLRLMVDAVGRYVFVDEIEIYGRRGAVLPGPEATITDTTAFLWRSHAAARLKPAVERMLKAAEARLASARVATGDRSLLITRVTELEGEMRRLPMEVWAAANPQYPFNDLHAAALGVIGRIEQLEGAPLLRAWVTNPWDPLTLTTGPSSQSPGHIEAALMNGEVRAAALNVRNSSDRPLRVTVDLDGVGPNDPKWIEARSVAWTGDAEGYPVAAALLPTTQKLGPLAFDVPGGVTRQVWLSFTPTHLAVGMHQGSVHIAAPGAERVTLPMRIRILPGRFPAKSRLHVGGWDYLNDRGPTVGTSEYLLRIASLLADYGVDLPWATAAAMPFGRYDARGNMEERPDTAVFDSWIARWPRASRYRLYISGTDRLSGLPRGSPAFESAVKAWARFWAKHLAERGISPNAMDLLFVDEPHEPQQAARQVSWARAVRASGAGLRIWNNPTYLRPSDIPPDLIDSADTICLNRHVAESSQGAYWAFARRQLENRKGIELYDTDGPVTRLDPYAYYRVIAWRAFDIGASGISFWSFTDTGGASSWRPYTAPHIAYSPLFLDGSTANPGKHLEALREGVEDFEYLAMLRDAIAAAASRRPDDALVAEARALLAAAKSRVLAGSEASDVLWASPKDRTAADRSRIEIAEMLERITPR